MKSSKPLAEPRRSTVRRLFALSRNQCSLPGCTEELFRGETPLGDICHIEGSKPGSARYREGQDAEERHGFENLILLCKQHHNEVDADVLAYPVARLKEFKRAHEADATALDESLIEAAVRVFVALLEADTVNVQTMSVGTMNVLSASTMKSEAFAPGEGPLGVLAPELARVLARQIGALDRATAQFLSASAAWESPTDPWTTFRPFKPTLYPSAQVCRELSYGDTVLLVEFYEGIQEIDDLVVQWHGDNPKWDMNTWNVLMQRIARNVEAGLKAVTRFCPQRLTDSTAPAVGMLSERGAKSIQGMQAVLTAHIDRFTRLQAAHKSARDRFKIGVRPGDFASELAQLAGGTRGAWLAAVNAASVCAALPLKEQDHYYHHRLRGLSRDEIALLWLDLARQRKLSLDVNSRPDPVAVSH
jgi:hypothetical protein